MKKPKKLLTHITRKLPTLRRLYGAQRKSRKSRKVKRIMKRQTVKKLIQCVAIIAAVDVAVFVTICTAKAVLIITAPVWILPYAIWRKGVSSEIQTVEKELQEKTWSKPAVRVGQAKTAQACKKKGKADK